jgi:hypothetical protein
MTLKSIEKAVKKLKPEDQRKLLRDLPSLIFDREDLLWLKASERSFSFWDNPEDEVYDKL